MAQQKLIKMQAKIKFWFCLILLACTEKNVIYSRMLGDLFFTKKNWALANFKNRGQIRVGVGVWVGKPRIIWKIIFGKSVALPVWNMLYFSNYFTFSNFMTEFVTKKYFLQNFLKMRTWMFLQLGVVPNIFTVFHSFHKIGQS